MMSDRAQHLPPVDLPHDFCHSSCTSIAHTFEKWIGRRLTKRRTGISHGEYRETRNQPRELHQALGENRACIIVGPWSVDRCISPSLRRSYYEFRHRSGSWRLRWPICDVWFTANFGPGFRHSVPTIPFRLPAALETETGSCATRRLRRCCTCQTDFLQPQSNRRGRVS